MTKKTYGSLEEIQGTYRGFMPTDGSDIGMGELEIRITKKKMKIRHATGNGIASETVSLNSLIPMTKNEIKLYENDDEIANRTIGFSIGYVKLLFLPQAKKKGEPALCVVGNEMADILGPTFLYNQKQIEKGFYDKIVSLFEEAAGPGCFPTLKGGGKASDTYQEE